MLCLDFSSITGWGYSWTSGLIRSCLAPLGSLHAFLATCMSREEFGDLSRRVDTLSQQVAALTEAVGRLTLVGGPSQLGSSSYTAVSLPRAPESVAPSSIQSSSSIYNDLALQIPVVPDFAVQLCSSLRGGTFTAYQRASRAWEIGYWARFVLEERVEKPRPSKPLDLSNSCYVVLKAEGFETPLLCLRASDYRAVVGQFQPGTLSHGFPSQSEAKVYCAAAGVNFPSSVYQWRPQS